MAKPIDLTGQKFGMLTVVKRAENEGRYVRWYCNCDCGTTNFIVRGNDLKLKRVKSCGCKSIKDINSIEKKRAKQIARQIARENAKKMLEQEKLDWDELYEYVRCNVMNYDKKQALSSSMVLRLKGLLSNKFIENNNIKSTADYSYKTILNTFKACSPQIQRAFRTNNFKDEQHKFNYVLKIVESNINDVYIKMKNVEKAKEEAKNVVVETYSHTGVEYKPLEKKKDKFSDLW